MKIILEGGPARGREYEITPELFASGFVLVTEEDGVIETVVRYRRRRFTPDGETVVDRWTFDG